MSAGRRMDPREAELMAEIERLRIDLRTRSEAAGRLALALVDPRESVREHPVGSIVAAVSAGIALGAAGGRGPRGGGGNGLSPWRGDLILAGLVEGAVGRLMEAALPALLDRLARDKESPDGKL